MRITSFYNGQETVLEIAKDEAVIGRPSPAGLPDIDLSADVTVSRKHARIWQQEDGCWIEDFGSKYGTQVNGVKIDYHRMLKPGDTILIGETTLRVESPARQRNYHARGRGANGEYFDRHRCQCADTDPRAQRGHGGEKPPGVAF